MLELVYVIPGELGGGLALPERSAVVPAAESEEARRMREAAGVVIAFFQSDGFRRFRDELACLAEQVSRQMEAIRDAFVEIASIEWFGSSLRDMAVAVGDWIEQERQAEEEGKRRPWMALRPKPKAPRVLRPYQRGAMRGLTQRGFIQYYRSAQRRQGR